MIDWRDLLDRHHIEYSTSGPNVGRNNISTNCPWCGSSDETQHLSISLEGNGYRCWRNPTQHKGKNPAKLLMALLGCDYQQAAKLVGSDLYIPVNFADRVNAMLNPPSDPPTRTLGLPDEFRPLSSKPSCRPFIHHLVEERKYKRQDVLLLSDQFKLHYCTRGPFHSRIIFPVYFEKSLVTWTGRSVSKRATLRYRALSADPETAKTQSLPCAIGPTTDYLLWHDQLDPKKYHTIILSEGPMDAMRIWWLGRKLGICSTCFFTSAPSVNQIDKLHEILPRFERRFIMLDAGTFGVAMTLAAQLSALKAEVLTLPPLLKDPGELLSSKDLLNVGIYNSKRLV